MSSTLLSIEIELVSPSSRAKFDQISVVDDLFV